MSIKIKIQAFLESVNYAHMDETILHLVCEENKNMFYKMKRYISGN